MQNPRLLGLVAAVHTPFHEDGALRLDAVERQAEYLQTQGLKTVFVGGSTGESHSLSCAEREQLAQRWVEVVRGTDLRVVVHVGSNCLAEARQLAAQAERLGATAIAALAPSYFKPRSLDTLIACVAEIASAASQTPFYFYDIPVLTGVNFSMPEFLGQARGRVPTLVGLKFTNSDLMAYQLCLHADEGVWDVPWGVDEYLLAAVAVGAQGAVGSSYNFAAPIYQRLLAAAAAGDMASARKEQFRSVQLIQLLGRYGYMGAAKAVMGWLGAPVGPARLPHDNPTAKQLASLRGELETLGFFDWVRR